MPFVRHSPVRHQPAMTPGSLEDAGDASFHNDTLLDDQHDGVPPLGPRGNLDDRNVDTRRRHRDHTPLPPPPTLDDQRIMDDQRGINSMVNNAIQEFGTVNFLSADGSNFRAWTRDIEMIALSFLQDKDFFNSPCARPRLEPAGRRILLGVIDSSLKHELYSKESSYKMMEAIKARFSSVSKARMLTKWRELLRIQVDMTSNPASVATQYKAIVDELGDMGVYLAYDDLLPLILHDSIPQGSNLRQEFDRRIDAEFALNGRQVITFEKTWRILSEAICQVRAVDSLDNLQRLPHVMAAEQAPRPREERSASIISHPDNVYALAGNPQQNRRICFRCRSPNHLIGQCTAPDPATRPPNQQPRSQAQHGPIPPGFQAYYPIIAPTGAVPMYYPPRLNQQNPNSIPVQRGRMDSYRPQYGQQSNRPSARAAEPAGVPPSDPSFNNLDVSANPAGDSNPQDALFDTGASHHLTGDNAGVHGFYWGQWNDGDS
ncbi:uncharacterized protein PGTG_19638 [Puccinia graminis f. sp. tritici CRL 75-36-700-3]|uniref:CCHC-type domain-containing protein n=1 Tax=Puccinia graminis f. sp. tritici (strain CRL 75-36-700-3 / race SCCL) TaxID=418459 RepID=E3LAL0_PUCGT|nr:uncharacterized protein PGTG_19638 [Puccinia graminis f. sp. tritici CRL 75-36-700-3]EFP93585.1 hypothetical protein PGTG_19638 [Puccinia graminis f. sp. tritici CRL 75-36-700-3]